MDAIHFDRRGSGEPVVLVHGIGHRRQAWARVPELLAETNDVISVDLPGNGTSPASESLAAYGLRAVATQLDQLSTQLGLTRWHVVGNSLGGFLALELARRGRVASATALAPAGFWNLPEFLWAGMNLTHMKIASHAPEALQRRVAASARLRRVAMSNLYVHPERLTPEEFIEDTHNLRDSHSFWRHYVNAMPLTWRDEPVVPTTIAWGDKDRLLLPRQAERARKRLPDVNHVTLPDCGHCPMLDDPELVVRVIRETIARA